MTEHLHYDEHGVRVESGPPCEQDRIVQEALAQQQRNIRQYQEDTINYVRRTA